MGSVEVLVDRCREFGGSTGEPALEDSIEQFPESGRGHIRNHGDSE
jgi:hypothetical protein